jgi:hypothetical protein
MRIDVLKRGNIAALGPIDLLDVIEFDQRTRRRGERQGADKLLHVSRA